PTAAGPSPAPRPVCAAPPPPAVPPWPTPPEPTPGSLPGAGLVDELPQLIPGDPGCRPRPEAESCTNFPNFPLYFFRVQGGDPFLAGPGQPGAARFHHQGGEEDGILGPQAHLVHPRSEERRVGQGRRSWWS